MNSFLSSIYLQYAMCMTACKQSAAVLLLVQSAFTTNKQQVAANSSLNSLVVSLLCKWLDDAAVEVRRQRLARRAAARITCAQ